MLEEIKIYSNISEMCRTCLAQDCQTLFPIFQNTNDERTDAKLAKLSQIQIVPEEGLPNGICEICMQQTNSAFEFVRQVKNADAMLKRYKDTRHNFLNIDRKPQMQNLLQSTSADCFKYIKTETEAVFIQDTHNRSINSDRNIGFNSFIKTEIPIENASYNLRSVHEQTKAAISKVKSFRDVNTCSLCSKILNCESTLVKHMRHVHNMKKPFVCDFCNWSFIRKHSLGVHIRIKHTRDRIYKCDSCPKSFIERRDLNKHKSSHVSRFTCGICEKVFNFKQSLKAHMRLHRRSFGKHPCPECGKLFADEHQLKRHAKSTHTGEKHACSHCHKTFPHKYRLKKHLLCHNNTEERKFKCQFCSKKFNYFHHLRNHENTHLTSKPFLCSKCGRGFAQSYNLTLHLRQHENVRPFTCKICQKQFVLHQRLLRHLETHKNAKSTDCKICGVMCDDFDSLHKHMDLHVDDLRRTKDDLKLERDNIDSKKQLESSEKSFKCGECGTGFVKLSYMKKHLKNVHLKERTFKCTKCSSSFFRRSELKIHQRRHDGIKPYVCSICNKGFVLSSALQKHSRTHINKLFICQVCNLCFKTMPELNAHSDVHKINVVNTNSDKYYPILNIGLGNDNQIATRSIIFVNELGDYTNQPFGENTIIYNIQPSSKDDLNISGTNLNQIESQNSLKNNTKLNNELIESMVNVIHSDDGKLYIQIPENTKFTNDVVVDKNTDGITVEFDREVMQTIKNEGLNECLQNETIICTQDQDPLNLESNPHMPCI